MRSLYKIKVRHSGPKDSHDAIEGYLVAESEEQVYEAINDHNFGTWSDQANDDDPETEYCDREGKVIQGGYKAWVMAWRGDLAKEESDYYYGVTQYGWEKVEGVTQFEIDRLLSLGIASQHLA